MPATTRCFRAALVSAALGIPFVVFTFAQELEPPGPPAPTPRSLAEVFALANAFGGDPGCDAQLLPQNPDFLGNFTLDLADVEPIDVLALSHRIENTTVTPGGATPGRGEHGRLVITKNIDASSPFLALAVCEGRLFPQVFLELAGTDFRISLDNVIVQRTASAAFPSGGDFVHIETIELNYGMITWTYAGSQESWVPGRKP